MYKFVFILLFIDLFYLSTFGKYFSQLVETIQNESMKMNYIGVFFSYLLISFALYYFIIKDKRPVLDAFILGVILYGVFDFTNLALFRKDRKSVV
jgi:uncharacterized BrkB/YihY/UPF0761 family membrane protein